MVWIALLGEADPGFADFFSQVTGRFSAARHVLAAICVVEYECNFGAVKCHWTPVQYRCLPGKLIDKCWSPTLCCFEPRLRESLSANRACTDDRPQLKRNCIRIDALGCLDYSRGFVAECRFDPRLEFLFSHRHVFRVVCRCQKFIESRADQQRDIGRLTWRIWVEGMARKCFAIDNRRPAKLRSHPPEIDDPGSWTSARGNRNRRGFQLIEGNLLQLVDGGCIEAEFLQIRIRERF